MRMRYCVSVSIAVSLLLCVTAQSERPKGPPQVENATVQCTSAVVTCNEGFIWVGSSSQTVHYDSDTMKWTEPTGRCLLASDAMDECNGTVFEVPPTQQDSQFGVCLRLLPSAGEDSYLEVSLNIGEDSLMRFSLNYSCDTAVLSSVFDGNTFFNLFLTPTPSVSKSAPTPASTSSLGSSWWWWWGSTSSSSHNDNDNEGPTAAAKASFLNATSELKINVLQRTALESEYEISDGQVSFTGKAEEWPDTSLSVRRVDAVTVSGDAEVITVNTRCVPES